MHAHPPSLSTHPPTHPHRSPPTHPPASPLPVHPPTLARSNLASELATLAFYVACGASFRPLPANANPYFQLTDEEAIELTRAEDP